MSDVVVRAEGVSKLYRIGEGRRHDRLRDLMAEAMSAPFRRLGRSKTGGSSVAYPSRSGDDLLWALRDVSFEVHHGEVIGIIGANGAGKSTLLKILSRITEPTNGRVEMRGRLGSLLEVGTGFNPDLTGRENVYLSGAILGMKRSEIRRRFDEIVEFAEMERFIDTPVKRYSSGMYMRLAFAVAAHLEPDILVVDEVLAVGDASFQRKCLGKVGNVAQTGRTVLFVSHNMMAVEDLCDHAIWLEKGRVVDLGDPKPVVSAYLQATLSANMRKVWRDTATAPGNEDVRLLRAGVRPAGGSTDDHITVHSPLELEFEHRNLRPFEQLSLSISLHNEQGIVVFTSGTGVNRGWGDRGLPAGDYRAKCRIPGDLLNDGVHTVTVYVDKNGRTVLQQEDVLVFDVRDAVEARHGWHGKWVGAVRPKLEWSTELVEPEDGSAGGERHSSEVRW
jgi:lipopolysaccharide transport system ATP-binding protein